MESIEELLTCKVCMERYNDSDKKPLFLTCGHTFCTRCLRLIFKRAAMKCPLDKLVSKYEVFSSIPTNFSVLNCLHSQEAQKKGGLMNDKKCNNHPGESLKFYCISHDSLICQNCLIESHLGEGHQIQSSAEVLQGEILKSEL
jgi:hypothetical protein